MLDRWYFWPTVMVEGGGLGGLGRGWVILLDRWYFRPTVMVEGGGSGGLGRGWVILFDRWYFWPTVGLEFTVAVNPATSYLDIDEPFSLKVFNYASTFGRSFKLSKE